MTGEEGDHDTGAGGRGSAHSEPSDGVVEQAARTLAVIVVRTRLAARQARDPAARQRLLAAGKAAAEKARPAITSLARRTGEHLTEQGPELAETAAHQAVDRALSSMAARAGFLGAALHQLRPAATHAAGQLARALADAMPPGKVEPGGGAGPRSEEKEASRAEKSLPANEGEPEGTASDRSR